MESSQKNTLPRGKETRELAPSFLQPLPLSERSDGSLQPLLGNKRMAATPGNSIKTERATLVVVDRKLVGEAATWISAKIAATLKLGAQEVGEYLLERFFENDPELARSRTPHKNASFRALAEKCGTPELPVSKTWLNNAVGIALIIRQLPESARAFRKLPPSYQETLLPLGDPTRVEKVAKQAVTKELSFRELRQAVAEERAKLPRSESRGRPPTPMVVKALSRSIRLFMLAGGKRSFTKADVEELDEEQRKEALESAEKMIERLEDLVGKLKEV